MKRIALALTVAMVLAAFGCGIASADPLNSKKTEVFTISCNNGQTYQIVAGEGVTGHLLRSTSNLIVTKFTFSIVDPDTLDVIYSVTDSIGQGNKKGLHQDDLLQCTTAPRSIIDDETGEMETVVIEVEAFLTPRGR